LTPDIFIARLVLGEQQGLCNIFTAPRSILVGGGGMGNRYEIKSASGRRRKGNSFYDDVMQGVFSIFFSFLFLPSL
jgi:hypothetical protein